MSFLSALKGAFGSAAKELNKEYGKSKDFLHAVSASAALIIFADGTAEEAEIRKAKEVLGTHVQLSAIYTRQDIEAALSSALGRATSATGRNGLVRDLDKVLGLPNGRDMADDVYLMAVDISTSNSRGEAGDDEQRVLKVIAKHLQVDPAKFELV